MRGEFWDADTVNVTYTPEGIGPKEKGYTADLYGVLFNRELNYSAIMPDRNLWISGVPGTGKTGMAVLIGKEYGKHGRKSLIVRIPYLWAGIDSGGRIALMERARTTKVLILDDYHRYRWDHETATDFMFMLIDQAVNHNQTLIITSQVKFEELRKKTPPDYNAIFDRICEGGLTEIETTGESVRG